MLAPGIWKPIVENVRVKHGEPISPGKNVTFSYHVNYLVDISGIHSSEGLFTASCHISPNELLQPLLSHYFSIPI
jgi:hypothetical protein